MHVLSDSLNSSVLILPSACQRIFNIFCTQQSERICVGQNVSDNENSNSAQNVQHDDNAECATAGIKTCVSFHRLLRHGSRTKPDIRRAFRIDVLDTFSAKRTIFIAEDSNYQDLNICETMVV